MLVLGALVCGALLTACSSIDCLVDTTVKVKYGIKTMNGTELATDTLKDTLNVWSRRRNGTDTLLLNSGVNITSFSLQISYARPEDTLRVQLSTVDHKTTTDTIWVQKNDIPHFESIDCAARYFHWLTAVRSTHHAIDTIIINNPSVTYDQSVTNLYISFKSDR